MNYLRQRVIHKCNVPLTVKELKAEYHVDPYFKDIVKFLEKDYCRYVGKAQTVFKMQCEDYVLVNGVLFKIKYDKAENLQWYYVYLRNIYQKLCINITHHCWQDIQE